MCMTVTCMVTLRIYCGGDCAILVFCWFARCILQDPNFCQNLLLNFFFDAKWLSRNVFLYIIWRGYLSLCTFFDDWHDLAWFLWDATNWTLFYVKTQGCTRGIICTCWISLSAANRHMRFVGTRWDTTCHYEDYYFWLHTYQEFICQRRENQNYFLL